MNKEASDETVPLEWEEEYRIEFRHLGPGGQARVPDLIGLSQETAWKHAEAMGVGYSRLKRNNLMFALSRESIDLKCRPTYGDKITIKTRLPGMTRLYFYRDFLIEDASSDPILEARTTWPCLDTKSRRPRRLDELSEEFEFPFLKDPSTDINSRVRELSTYEHQHSAAVRPSDLDVNSHANNVQYLRWILDSLPLDFLTSRELDNFEVKYRAELSCGDGLVVERSELDRTVLHRIVREDDREIVALAESVWSSGND
ncbi:MAG: acyl-ACP thioesterase domain-containing protein [Candidatus Bipolaricaulota bacterium]